MHGAHLNDLKDVSVEIPKPPASTSPTLSSCSTCSTGLVDSGKSGIVIAHHRAVMAHADWIIDLGPGAGAGAGAGHNLHRP